MVSIKIEIYLDICGLWLTGLHLRPSHSINTSYIIYKLYKLHIIIIIIISFISFPKEIYLANFRST